MTDAKLLVVIVHHDHVEKTIAAIDTLIGNGSACKFTVVIADNSENEQQAAALTHHAKSSWGDVVEICSIANTGYFPAVNAVLKMRSEKPDFLIIANNDLIFGGGFMDYISNSYEESPFMIGYPDLCDDSGTPQNPRVEKRISSIRLLAYRAYYTNYWVSRIMLAIFSVAKAVAARLGRTLINTQECDDNGRRREILLGVGACIVISPDYFRHFSDVPGSVFLFGEEALLADRVREAGGRTHYLPNLRVKHVGKATVSLMGGRRYWFIQKKSAKEFIPALYRINAQQS